MTIHPSEPHLVGRILKTAMESYEDVLSTRSFLESPIRQNPAQLIELLQHVARVFYNHTNMSTDKTLSELLRAAGAKVPSNLLEELNELLSKNTYRYLSATPSVESEVMIDLTNPEAIRLENTGQPTTESQLRNLIWRHLQNKYRLQPDTLKTLAAVLGIPGAQYQALREILPETPWIVPSRAIYDRTLLEPPESLHSRISLIDLTGNDPFRLPVGLLNVFAQRAIPRIKLPNPNYGGRHTLQVPDLVLESALLEGAIRDYVTERLVATGESPLSLYTLGELVGALRAIQPALIDQFVNSPEGQQILRSSSLPGVKRLIEDVKTQLRHGFAPELDSSSPNEQAFRQGLENVRVSLNALNLPEWMRRRLPARKAEIVDPTIATDAIKTLQKMVLIAAAPTLLKRGIDPMKATIPQVMDALRMEQDLNRPQSESGFLFNLASRGHIKKPWVPRFGRSLPALPELLLTARALEPRVEKLPLFQELTAIARQAHPLAPKMP